MRFFCHRWLLLLCLLLSCSSGETVERPEDLQKYDEDAFWHGGDVAQPTGCQSDDQCDDLNVCTEDSCRYDGQCLNEALAAAPCDDGNACTTGDLCSSEGICGGGAIKDCDDLMQCTDDSCDPAVGCTHEPTEDGTECDDGELCSTLDKCLNGICSGTAPLCDDGNDCTADSCKPESGECTHFDQSNIPCDDQNACTNGDLCAAGTCIPGSPAQCDDNNPCTMDDCLELGTDEGGGCTHLPEVGKVCDDQNPCSIDDLCDAAGDCLGQGGSCDDEDPCTTDLCSPIDGCYHEPANGEACDDNNPCTGTGTCKGGKCADGPAINCNDGVDCTLDSCDEIGQCVHTPDDTFCDDELFCNGGEFCDPVMGCFGDGPPDEDDGIDCTVDSCLEEPDILQHLPQHFLCDDDDSCTIDSCNPLEGCQHPAKVCDDDNPCTVDSCEAESGECLFAPLGECCMVDSDCISEDPCFGGNCDIEDHTCSFSSLLCDDHNPCTVDSCEGGCKHEPLDGCISQCASNLDCFFAQADPDLCTVPTCTIEDGIGSCSYPLQECTDGLLCTEDSCDSSIGCQYISIPWCQQPCADDIDCASDDACDTNTCVEGLCSNQPDLCDDGLACTGGECHPLTGNCELFECPACVCPTCESDEQCDDGSLCTHDICLLPGEGLPGQCRHIPVVCNDGNPCTTDLCLNQSGCQFYDEPTCTGCHTPADCADETECTTDSCEDGLCKHLWICE